MGPLKESGGEWMPDSNAQYSPARGDCASGCQRPPKPLPGLNFRTGSKTFCVFEMVRGRPSIGFRLEPADVRRVAHGANGFDTPYGRQRWASVWVDSEVDCATH
jgi:hypothetical protein